MLGIISKAKEAGRDISDNNHLLDMMSSSSANFVNHETQVNHISNIMRVLRRKFVDVP